MLVTFAIGMAYHLPFLRVRGATLGLMACGLRVVPVDEGQSTRTADLVLRDRPRPALGAARAR